MTPKPPQREVELTHLGVRYVVLVHALDTSLGAHECSVFRLLRIGKPRWVGFGMYARRFSGRLVPRTLSQAITDALAVQPRSSRPSGLERDDVHGNDRDGHGDDR